MTAAAKKQIKAGILIFAFIPIRVIISLIFKI